MLLDILRAIFHTPVPRPVPVKVIAQTRQAQTQPPRHAPVAVTSAPAVITPFTPPASVPARARHAADARTHTPQGAKFRQNPHQHSTAKPGQIACPDMLALVLFDHEARLVQPFAGAFDADLARAVSTLPGKLRGGSTNIAAGLALANDLLARQPAGLLRRIWLLSDGFPYPTEQPIDAEVARARAARTNINTVGIGDPGGYDRALLERIAAGTHNGRFAEADTIARLDALMARAAGPRPLGSHRGEATVFVIDASSSMTEPMGQARRIDAVATAMLGLLRFKQARWS